MQKLAPETIENEITDMLAANHVEALPEDTSLLQPLLDDTEMMDIVIPRNECNS